MMREQPVVVGVDGSPASYTALRWALSCAARTGAQVCATRCWMPVVARGWEAVVIAEPVPPEAEQEARAERELAEVVAAALARVPDGAAGVAVRQRVVRGPAGPVLVAEADGADLLVVGHGPRVAELLHRSVSWYCVRHATCPVLVIPPAMATRRTLIPATAEVPT
jgi:nucleotide-binding universal stress UspA family protein